MNRLLPVLMCCCVLTLAAGCGDKHDKMSEMKHADMKPPARAAELDKLQFLAGRWDWTMEMSGAEIPKPMTVRGTSTNTWECDGRLLVERSEGDMGEMGRYHGFSVTYWDPKREKYAVWYTNNMGETSHATMWYDENSKTWHAKGHSKNQLTGQSKKSTSTAKQIDANTIEWSFTDWNSWKTKKMIEGRATSRRKL